MVVPDNIIFNGIFQNPNYYNFGNCVFVDGNLVYNDNIQNFTVAFSSIPFQVCPNEEDLMDIEDFFQNEFFFDVFMVSWHEPFSYVFTTQNNTIYLDITNSEGSVATFYDNVLRQEAFLRQNVKIYPNPVVNDLFIESNQTNIQELLINDLSGRIVLKQDGLENNQLDVSKLRQRIYILKIKTSNGHINKKIVKK